ncbi:serine hydrolase [Novosphingobium marinum]|uniref:CubicO group peptidase (Beta-lactamase class C family) n=1 Tax=Novosphingobium marinum TaxID=1514948 RepID=A0A7Y9XVD7_9SPHN|nr:serine hydrolase domain-containing protein [Novosphingobium marinum]NYH95192.1 CubicO group peptidase (beta-lactamase class C family) [Novosphingobium marinum]GGC25039.1 serine hydrolase [Novosphingobium marinum]
MTIVQTETDRRAFVRGSLLAGLGVLAAPRLALARSDADLLPAVTEVIERWVGPGKFPGIVASLGLPGREAQYVARGSEGFTDPDPIGADSLFRIYSMTKPVTGMATMMLIAEGRLGLDQPLHEILPQYREMKVQATPDGSVTDVRPARTPITIRHLLTHTSGLGYTIIQKGPIRALMEEKGLVAGQIARIKLPGIFRGATVGSLKLFADRLADVPLVYEPGTKWSYSLGLDLLGRVIEVVGGTPFDRFLHERIFEPTGMTSTWFRVPRSQAHRLATNHAMFAGRLIPFDKPGNSIFLDEPAFPFGGSGLVSSPRDYDRFLRMLAGLGEIDGTRVMPAEAVRLGTSNLLPAGVEGPALMMPKSDFGAGGRVGIGEEAGIYGWAGAAGTVGMVDVSRGLRSSIFLQFMPPDALPILNEFQHALRSDVMRLAERNT